jgi:hypothetical protein
MAGSGSVNATVQLQTPPTTSNDLGLNERGLDNLGSGYLVGSPFPPM